MNEHSENDDEGFSVAVRSLCEFTARTGDLDHRFIAAPSALEGIEGHRQVRQRRDSAYQSEVSLSGDCEGLRLRGRADGFCPTRQRLEEIKTHRGDIRLVSPTSRSLHWAQASIYGWLLCRRDSLSSVTLALVYFNIDTAEETVYERIESLDALGELTRRLCLAYRQWAMQERRHRARRDASVKTAAFPFAHMRPSQRTLAEGTYKALRQGRALMVQAPTGSGKTLGMLFPALKAMPAAKLSRVFFLTAKTSGRRVALDAMDQFGPEFAVRRLELSSREAACVNPDLECHGDSCPLARGFYDRLPAARQALVTASRWDQDALRSVAAEHGICPYHLSHEMIPFADVVVGDYHHYFSAAGLLYALMLDQGWRAAVLVDEAHNLLGRAQEMYSASLHRLALLAAIARAPANLRRVLRRLDRQWQSIDHRAGLAYTVHEAIPEALKQAINEAGEALFKARIDAQGVMDEATLELGFALGRFSRLLDSFGSHTIFESHLEAAAESRIALRCANPAPHLVARMKAASGVVLTSATLAPFDFYRDTLGLPDGTVTLDVPAAFSASQIKVHIPRGISTRYADRTASVDAIVSIIASHYRKKPGNYLAFFSSFAYLQQVAGAMRSAVPDISVLEQTPGMSEADQGAFLAAFTDHSCHIAFAVLGGAFAEGIDLPGRRCIGAFVATLGLPPVNAPNETVRQRLDDAFGRGYDYTYLYPGLRKVVQAAGRVIRTESDSGVVVLLDDRFHQSRVKALLPTWWPAATVTDEAVALAAT